MSDIVPAPENQAAVAAPAPAAKSARKAPPKAVSTTKLDAAAEWPTPAAPMAPEAAAKPEAAQPKTKAAVPVKAAVKKVAAKKAAAKTAAKPAAVKPVKAAKSVKVGKAKPEAAPVEAKPVKVKLVRDSFTIPAGEYAQLAVLKQRALKAAHPVKKSELLRAGVRLLAALSDKDLLAALLAVPAIKTGRPKGKKGD